MSSQLTTTGLSLDSAIEALTELENNVKANVDSEFNTGADAFLNKILAIIADAKYSSELLLQEIVDSQSPRKVTGNRQDDLYAINNLERKGATSSTVILTLSGDVGTTIPSGSIVAHATTSVQFQTLDNVTIPSGGSITVSARSVETGPIVALSGSLTVIVTPVSGWNSVTNALDATKGQNRETDEDFRIRRTLSAQSAAKYTDPARRAALLAIDGIESVSCTSNRTDVVDAFGTPAKAARTIISPTIVDPVVKEQIGRTIAAHIIDGAQAYGAETFIFYDSQGNPVTFGWDYATEVNIYMEIDLTVNSKFPTNGTTALAADVLEYGNSLSVGDDVIVGKFSSLAFGYEGVEDVVVRVDTVNPPVGTSNITIGVTSRAIFDSSRITVSIV